MGKDIGQDEGVSPEQGMGVTSLREAALAPSGLSPSGSQAEPPAANAVALHTPLPWSVGHRMEPNYLYGGGAHLACLSSTTDDGLGGDSFEPDDSEAAANAAFIVRACNSHYELLEALEYTLAALGTPVPIGKRHIARKIQAAIAKATGQ